MTQIILFILLSGFPAPRSKLTGNYAYKTFN